MNGPIQMYRTKPIVQHDLTVDLPKCMYKLKNIHCGRNGVVEGSGHVPTTPRILDIFDKNNQQIPEMTQLQTRQEQILHQLEELRCQVSSIRNNLRVDTDVKTEVKVEIKAEEAVMDSTTCSNSTQVNNLPNIIINASPTHPPYSLVLVQKLLQDSANLIFTCYIHSSISSLNSESASFQKTLESFKPAKEVPVIQVRLVWKDVDADIELVISHARLVGEVNILRYLARVFENHLNYENAPNPHEIDSLLDLSSHIVRSKTKTERGPLLQVINKSLGKAPYLLERTQISIADLAVYSAIKQVVSLNEVNANLSKWLHLCNNLIK